MACLTCNGPLVWRGSIGRGKFVCESCNPVAEEQSYVREIDGEYKPVSKTFARYHDEVKSFHRLWCTARKNAQANGKARSRDDECDCGFISPAKYSMGQIEQLEIKHYGRAK